MTAETWLPKVDKRRKAYKEMKKEAPDAKRRLIELALVPQRIKNSRPRAADGDERSANTKKSRAHEDSQVVTGNGERNSPPVHLE